MSRSGMAEMENLRHAIERGGILSCLSQDYGARMTSVRVIQGAMDQLGHSMSAEALGFHVEYLRDSGYLQVWRVQDLPGYRSDRPGLEKPDTIKFCKLTPRGVHLVDGVIAADPLVRFS